jgi:hypothetical protein
VLTEPPIAPNCSRSSVTDERRRRRLRPHRGTPLSGLPWFQLTPHRASSHRQEAFRPLLRYLRAPEHGPRCCSPTVVPPLQVTPHVFQVPPGAQGFTGAFPFLSPRRRRSPTTDHAGQISHPLSDRD